MITKGEVESADVHASVEHLAHLISIVAGRAQGADNACLALIEVHLLKDVLKSDTARVLTGRLASCFNHSCDCDDLFVYFFI